ncbi:MAG: hypothetical protein ABII12_17660 [Planctomycetota bacterium]
MAAVLWRRQFTARHVLLDTDAASGATLVTTAAGHPRISFPLTLLVDRSVVVPIGILADYLSPADPLVRVRLHGQGVASENYTLAARFMARRPGLDGAAEVFAPVVTQFAEQSLPATGVLQDAEVSIPAGDARDNAQDGDTLYMLLILLASGGVSQYSLLIETIDVWQEIP